MMVLEKPIVVPLPCNLVAVWTPGSRYANICRREDWEALQPGEAITNTLSLDSRDLQLLESFGLLGVPVQGQSVSLILPGYRQWLDERARWEDLTSHSPRIASPSPVRTEGET